MSEAKCPKCGAEEPTPIGMCRKCVQCGYFAHIAEFMPAQPKMTRGNPIALRPVDLNQLREDPKFRKAEG
jgi:hypothetical protein